MISISGLKFGRLWALTVASGSNDHCAHSIPGTSDHNISRMISKTYSQWSPLKCGAYLNRIWVSVILSRNEYIRLVS